jgi:hypothetical protein
LCGEISVLNCERCYGTRCVVKYPYLIVRGVMVHVVW